MLISTSLLDLTFLILSPAYHGRIVQCALLLKGEFGDDGITFGALQRAEIFDST